MKSMQHIPPMRPHPFPTLPIRHHHPLPLPISSARQIVRQHSQNRRLSSQLHRFQSLDRTCRIDAHDHSLCCRLFISRRSVDLSREESGLSAPLTPTDCPRYADGNLEGFPRDRRNRIPLRIPDAASSPPRVPSSCGGVSVAFPQHRLLRGRLGK